MLARGATFVCRIFEWVSLAGSWSDGWITGIAIAAV
jgi:hypothetical protein